MALETPTWLKIEEVSSLLNIKEKTIKDRCYKGLMAYKIIRKNNKNQYYIHFDSIPQNAKRKVIGEVDSDIQYYSEAPAWAKLQADKYMHLLKQTENLKGSELREFIETWNKQKDNSETSYTSIMRMRQRYAKHGINGLLAKYGTNATKSKVQDEFYNYFKTLYLKQGGPSIRSCWENTLGFALRTTNVLRADFPSPKAFI